MPRILKQHIFQLWMVALVSWSFLILIREHLLWHTVANASYDVTNDPPSVLISRKKRVTSYCNKHLSEDILHNPLNPALNGVFVADRKRKFLCALNFKIGSSTLVPALLNSSGLVPPNKYKEIMNAHITAPKMLEKYGLSIVSSRNRTFIKEYQSYFKFMFVRNPYHRLLSAFRDKFRIHKSKNIYDAWFSSTVKKIIKTYRNQTRINLAKKLTETAVTFEEFLHFVMDDIEKYETTNDHWKPIYRLSMPCMIKYDFIGNFETFDQDFHLLMTRVAVVEVPEIKRNLAPSNSTSTVFKNYWKQIPMQLVREIENVYEKDFEMFDYDKKLTDYL